MADGLTDFDDRKVEAFDDDDSFQDVGLLRSERRKQVIFTIWRRRITAGVTILLLVANTIGQGQYARISYHRIQYSSYYFLCWFTNIFLTMVFPLFIAAECSVSKLRNIFGKHSFTFSGYVESVKERVTINPDFSVKKYMITAMFLTLFNFFSSYTWYISLDLIPVSINAALYKSTIVFVFVLSVIFLKEKVVVLKVLALLACVTGVVLVGVGNSLGSVVSPGAVGGYCLVIGSAFLTACYEVAYRRQIGDANVHGVLLIESMLGFYALTVLWILIPILFQTHVEPIPNFNGPVIEFLFVNMLFAVSYYLLYALGMAVTSALYMSVSGMIAIPISGLVDFLFVGVEFHALTIVGMCVVFVGVLLINFENWFGDYCGRCAKKPDRQEVAAEAAASIAGSI